MPEGLKWPPRKEDLERLYLGQRLSAAKVAEAYGLKSANPKSGETLVLYHLRRFGIARRDRAEHIRKVTSQMVDGWVRRYEVGESLKQIAGSEVDSVTVWNHLKKRGVVLRDKVEAQIRAVTKYERRPFGGDELEKAYLAGLRYGDLHAVRHGRAIRVRVSTTHPAMADLFENLFSPYSHVSRYPRTARLTGYEWSLECDLDCSFEFLLNRLGVSELEALTAAQFIKFLAGVFDPEGSILLHRKQRWFNPEAWISNSDPQLINFVAERLRNQGYHASVRWSEQRLDRGGVEGRSKMGRVEVLRFREAQRFLHTLPIRHAEKLARKDLVLKMSFRSPAEVEAEVSTRWKALSAQIRVEIRNFAEAARLALAARKPKACQSS